MPITFPKWVSPVVPANDLNRQRSVTTLSVIAEDELLPIVVGEDQVPGLIGPVDYDAATGTWTVGVFWCAGEVEAVAGVYMNGAAPVAGVTRNDYVGAVSQGVDPLLAAAIGSSYQDDYVISRPGGDIGVCYSAIQWTDDDYKSFPQFAAQIQGLKTNSGAYSDTPAHALGHLIEHSVLGPGLTADATSLATIVTDNQDTVITEERRKIGLTLSEALPWPQWIRILTQYAACWANRRGDTFYFTSDRPVANPSNTPAYDTDDWDSFAFLFNDRDRIPTVVELEYTDTSETLWRPRTVTKKLSGVSAGTVPRRVSRVKMPGVKRYSQAARECNERLNKLQNYLGIAYDGFDDAVVHEPGDVIDISRRSYLSSVDFRIVEAGRKTLGGPVVIQAVKYNESDYVDTEESAPSDSSSDQFLGAGVSVAGNLALKLNALSDGTANDGEAVICGIDANGAPDFTKDGVIRWDGSKVTVPRDDGGAGNTIGTAVADTKGFIAFDTAGTQPFTVSSVSKDLAFAYKKNGQWYYDDQSGSDVSFSPTSDMVALGWIETSTADLIAAGGLFGEPVTLTVAAAPAATEGATLGTDLKDESDTVLNDIDVKNDQFVGNALGGSLLANPTLDFARKRTDDSGLRPIGWFIRGNSEDEVAYSNSARDTVDLTQSGGGSALYFISQAVQINDETEYEIVIVARSDTPDTVGLTASEHTAAPSSGKVALSHLSGSTFTDSEIETSTGSGNTIDASLTLTGTMAAYTKTYTPTAGTQYASFFLSLGPSEHIEIDSIWLRTKSTRGATAGSTLKDSNDNVLDDDDVLNSKITTLYPTKGLPVFNRNTNTSGEAGPRNPTVWRYKYSSFAAEYYQGGTSAPGEAYPWVDTIWTVFIGQTEVAEITLRSALEYGLAQSSSSRSGTSNLSRTFFYDFQEKNSSGLSASDFTVTVDGTTLTLWDGTVGGTSNLFDEFDSNNYDGDKSVYDIVVAHDASGIESRVRATVLGIGAINLNYSGSK